MTTRQRQKKNWVRIITFIVIITLLCQGEVSAIAPYSKTTDLTPVFKELAIAGDIAKVLKNHFVSNMKDLQRKIDSIEEDIERALGEKDRDFKYAVFNGNIYVLRKNIVFRFVINEKGDHLYTGLMDARALLLETKFGEIPAQVFRITEEMEIHLGIMKEFMPGRLKEVYSVSRGSSGSNIQIPPDLHKRMVRFYTMIKKQGLFPGRLEGNEVGIRDIKAWVRFIERFKRQSGLELAVIKGVRYVFGDRIEKEKQDDFEKILHSVFSDFITAVSRRPRYGDQIDFVGDRLRIRDTFLQINPEPGEYVPSKESSSLVITENTPHMLYNVERIALSIAMNDPILLIGETGVGKTAICRYLAYLTKNNFRRFNLNGLTDKMEFIGGYKPQSDGSMKWEDGILIKAMQNGDWLLLDEINLAEPEIVERINSLLDDERSLVLSEHEGERYVPKHVYDQMVEKGMDVSNVYPIHPNFRILATMNPPDYEGRKALSPAFMNRFRIKWIEELPETEMIEVLRRKYGFSTEVLEKIYRLHVKMRGLGLEKRHFTLRNMFRLADRIFHYYGTGLNIMNLLLREAYEVYGDGLGDEKEILMFERILNDIFGKGDYPGVDRRITRSKDVVKIGDVVLGIYPDGPDRTEVPGEEADLLLVPGTVDILYKIAKGIQMNERLLLIGPTGAGKTSFIRYLAHLTNNNFRRVNLDGQTDTSELLGEYVPTGVPGEYEWRDGILVEAMKRGDWLLLDEFNLAEPEIMERINSLLDDDGYLVLTEHEGEKIVPHPNFRLFGAMNPERYAGRQRISPAMKNKFNEKWISGDMPYDEMVAIAGYYLKKGRGIDKNIARGIAEEMVKFHLRIVQEVNEQRLGGKKLGPEAEVDYRFSLRDLKAWANYIKGFSTEDNKGLALIKGALYIYRDRLRIESIEEMERFRQIVKEMNFNRYAPKDRQIDLDDILEPPYEFRSRLERIVRGEATGEEAGDILFILTQGYPTILEKPIKEIAKQLSSSDPQEKINGISAINLFPSYVTQKILEALMRDFKYHHSDVKLAIIEFLCKNRGFITQEILSTLMENFDTEGPFYKTAVIKLASYLTHSDRKTILRQILGRFNKLPDDVRLVLLDTLAETGLLRDKEFQDVLADILIDRRYTADVRARLLHLILRHNVSLRHKKRGFGIVSFLKIFFKAAPGSYEEFIPQKWTAIENIINISFIVFFGCLGFINPGILVPVVEFLKQISIFVPLDFFTSGILGVVFGGLSGLIINPLLKFIIVYSRLILLCSSLPLAPDEFFRLYKAPVRLRTIQVFARLKFVPNTRLFIENYERMVEVTIRNISMWEKETSTGKVTRDAYTTGKIEVSGDGKTLRIMDTVIPIKSKTEEIEEVRSLTLNRSTLENLEKIAQAVVLNDPLLLIGETGVGKTSLIRYLAHLTGNTFRRFNLNGQTDKLEFIGGYRPVPGGGLEWFDGILIAAMKNGYWLLLDEMNLAEPQVLERINSLLDDDGYIILREHKGEKIKPHPDFRLFATMNPSEYAGRNLLSPAFMNRFRVKWITEPLQDEILGILFDKYYLGESKAQKLDDLLLAKTVLFHKAMQELANDRVLGADESELYHYTLRNLLRLMDRVNSILNERKAGETLSEDELLKIVVTETRHVYGDMLRQGIDRSTFEKLLSVYFGVKKEEEEEYDIQYDARGVRIGEAKLESRPDDVVVDSHVPGESSRLTHVPTTIDYLYKIAQGLKMRENILLVGPTGSSKTSLVRYLAYLTNNNFIRVNLDTHTDTSELMGEYIPTGEKGVYKWKDGILVEAMKNGYWLLLDEFNLAEPEIIERMNSLLDDDGYIILTEHKGEKIRPHPNFRLFCAMNPPEYKGRNRLSIALRNKFMEIWIPGEFKDEELMEIVMDYLGNFKDKEGLAEKIVRVHKKVKERLGRELKEDEVAELTLRDLKSWANFINRFATALGLKNAFTLGAHYVYRDRLGSSELKGEFDMILPPVKDKDVLQNIINFIGRNPEGGELVPPKEIAELVMTEKTRLDLAGLACAVVLKEPMLLIGETGVGKTSLIRYLAYLTNNNLRRFNLNGQTDKFEFLGGYRPQPDGSIKWEDGILIRAMKNGDWITLDEINLAEPQVLERINSLLDDDGYIVLREHEGEKIKPHPNFRLFATMNPSEYSGRKELSRAMLNRFRIRWIEEPVKGELAQILGERYKDRLTKDILDLILKIHDNNAAISGDRKFTIRDLMKFAERVSYRMENNKLQISTREIVDEEANEIYGLGKDIVPGAIEKMDGKVFLRDIELKIKEGDGQDVPGEDSVLVPVRTTLRYLYKIARAILMKERPLLIGKTGSGKTALVRYLAHLTNTRFVRLNLDGQTDTAELIGEYVPGPVKGSYVWKDGILVDAMKKGYWILLDEVNLAEPDILERINSLLDDDSKIIITEHEGEVVRPHPDFRLFCAMNPPEGYSGRKNLSLAFQNKMTTIWLPDEMEEDELEYIVRAMLGMKAQVTDTPHPRLFIHDKKGVGEGGVSGYSPQKGTKGGDVDIEDDKPIKPPKGTGYKFAKPHYPKKGEGGEIGLLDKYKLWKKKRLVSKIIEAIAKATGGDVRVRVIPGEGWSIYYDTEPVTITYPMDEFLKEEVDVIIGKALHEAGHRKISYASSFAFGEETRRLLFNAVEDPRANEWQIKILKGARPYIARSYEKDWPEEVSGECDDEKVLPHEQFIDGIIYWWLYGKMCPAIKNGKVIDALRKTRDAFTEAYGILPGSEVTIRNKDGKVIFSTEEGDLEIKIPSEGGVAGKIPNTDIIVMVDSSGLIKLKTPIGLRMARIPQEGKEIKVLASVEPSEKDIKLAGQRSARIIKERILPVYEELVEESKKIVERLIREGKVSIGVGEGQPIPSELISGEAGKIIEERARQLADKLQGKIEGGDVREAKKEAEEVKKSRRAEGKRGEKEGEEVKEGEGVEPSERERTEEGEQVEGKVEEPEGKVSMTEEPKPEGEIRDKPARVDDEEAFRRLLDAEREKEKIRKEALKERIEEEYPVSRYDEWRHPISNLIRRLVGFLENILRKDTRPKYKGNYRTGRKLNLRRIMQLDRKIKEDLPLTSEDYKVMLRKTRPVKRQHKFALILDESGSMVGEQKNAISAIILFMEALSLLDIDFSVIGFHNSYVFHKEFKEKADFKKREEILREICAAMGRGGTNDTLAVKVALDDIVKEPATDRTIIVVTDGCGNGIGEMGPILEEAEREGVKVIGIGVGAGMKYVKVTYQHARTCETLEEVPEELAKVLVEEVFTKEPTGRMLLKRIEMGEKGGRSLFADSHISIEMGGTELQLDEGTIDGQGLVSGLADKEREVILNKVHDILKRIYGKNIFRYARGIRIKKDISHGGIAHYQDSYIDYDERLFNSIPLEYRTGRRDINHLALLFEQAEHELLESVLSYMGDISPEIREITVILQNILRFLEPNRGFVFGAFNEERYQETILRILSKDEVNGIDPGERYRNLLLEIRDKKFSKEDIILAIARYIKETDRYTALGLRIGDLSKRTVRKRIVKEVMKAEKRLKKVLTMEKTFSLWQSFIDRISSSLSFNPKYISIGAVSMLFVLVLRVFVLPLFSPKLTAITYPAYYNYKAEYYIQQIEKTTDEKNKKENLIKALENIYRTFRYSSNEDTRQRAMELLAEIGIDIPKLIEHASIWADLDISYMAEQILLEMGPVVVPYILDAIEKKDIFEKRNLAEILIELLKGKYGDKVREELGKRLGPDYEQKLKNHIYISAWKWDELVRQGKDGVKPLLSVLDDWSGFLRWDDIKTALLKIGIDGIDPLIDALEDKNTDIRNMSAEVLKVLMDEARDSIKERLGPNYKDVIESYLLLKKWDWDGIRKIGLPAIKPLIQYVNDQRNLSEDRANARQILEELKQKMYKELREKIKDRSMPKEEILKLINDYLLATGASINLIEVYNELIDSIEDKGLKSIEDLSKTTSNLLAILRDFESISDDGPIVLALDTDIGPVEQHGVLFSIYKALCEIRIDGIYIIRGRGNDLASKIQALNVKPKRIVIVAKDENLRKGYYETIKSDKTFITAICDAGAVNNYIPLIEIITLALEIADGKDMELIKSVYKEITDRDLIDEDLQSIIHNQLLIILPKPVPVDINGLRNIYGILADEIRSSA